LQRLVPWNRVLAQLQSYQSGPQRGEGSNPECF
jgi:hypothetical protein